MAVKKKWATRLARRADGTKAFQRSLCETLECRRLFAVASVAAVPPVLAHPVTPAQDSVDLSQFFQDQAITGTVVSFNTVEGKVSVDLTDQATPNTVANFLSYVNSSAYNNTFFHRSYVFSTGAGGSPTTPGDIIQGGGYGVSSNSINHIPTGAPVQDEYTTELYGDVAGTIAMAKTTMANSATSEFYFNVNNNTQDLDTPTTDTNGATTSYTVFGTVMGNGMSVVNAIAALPSVNLSNVNSALADLPVGGIPESQISTASITAQNLVFINTATVVPAVTYTFTSDNPALVTPTDNGNTLSFTYGAGMSGVAEITVHAIDADGVSTATQTFAVTVPDITKPTQGPTANADTSSDIVTGTSGVVHPLTNDTDSLGALLASTVTITTTPANGTATVDPTTGYISYTPNAGYTGVDTLQYTIKDSKGQTSAPGTVSLNVVPTPTQLTIGTPAARDLTYTQPDGTVAHITLTGATAVITFTSYQVQINTVAGHVTASGAGATITGITITNIRKNRAAFIETATGGVATLGGISDPGGLFNLISAANSNLTGSIDVASANNLILGSATNASIRVENAVGVNLSVNTATGTSVNMPVGRINVLKTNQWLDPQSNSTITTNAGLIALLCTGEFDPSIKLAHGPYFSANVGTIGAGTWTIPSYIGLIKAQTVNSAWSLSSTAFVAAIKIAGNFAGAIACGAIGNMTVGGSIQGAVIQTEANWTKSFVQIGKLAVVGTITNTKIAAVGNLGAITAAGLSNSDIYAGDDSNVIQSGVLPATVADLSAPGAIIRSIQLGKAGKFAGSIIASGTLGTLQLGAVTTSNSGTPQGVAGHVIGSLSAALDSGAVLAMTKAQLKSQATVNAYIAALKATLNDFQITILS